MSTGSNDIIGEIITEASPAIEDDLLKLMKGESVTTYVDTGVIYPEIKKKPSSVFSFLLTTGYLRIQSMYPVTDGVMMCETSIPNREISGVYVTEIIDRFPKGGIDSAAVGIQQAIIKKDFERLQKLLEDRESGYGRFDIQLEPMNKDLPGFIFELKFVRNPEADLDALLEEAVGQIEKKRYDVELQSRGIKEIIKIGIAFAGRRVKISKNLEK